MIFKIILLLFYGLVLYNFTFLDIGNIYNTVFESTDFIIFISNIIIAILGFIYLKVFKIKNLKFEKSFKNTIYSILLLYIFLIIGFYIAQEYLAANRIMLTVTKLSGYLAFLYLSIGLLISPILYFIKNIKIKLILILARKILGILVFIILIRHLIDFFESHYPFGKGFIDYFNYFISQIDNPVIWSGTVGAIGIVLLGVTSNSFSQIKLKKYWKKLHLLVFPIYIFSMLHVWYLGRIDWFYGGITAFIIFMRILVYILKRK